MTEYEVWMEGWWCEPEYEVWMEGWWCEPECEGTPVPHKYVGTFQAESFDRACNIAAMHMAGGDLPTFYKFYDINDHTWWGCRLFDNEEDAAKSFG